MFDIASITRACCLIPVLLGHVLDRVLESWTSVTLTCFVFQFNSSVRLFLYQKLLVTYAKNMSVAAGVRYEDLLPLVYFMQDRGLCQLELNEFKTVRARVQLYYIVPMQLWRLVAHTTRSIDLGERGGNKNGRVECSLSSVRSSGKTTSSISAQCDNIIWVTKRWPPNTQSEFFFFLL